MSCDATSKQTPNETWKKVDQWVNKRIKTFLDNPEKHADDPSCFAAAWYRYQNLPLHQCYWNDRFVLAVLFRLPNSMTRQAAWIAVTNGTDYYWEWTTHYGYDMRQVFQALGIPLAETDRGHGEYTCLRDELVVELIKRFDLPTTYGGVKQVLTEEERIERRFFNEHNRSRGEAFTL